jgi:hypothetical protein
MMVRPRVPLDGSSERLFLRLQFGRRLTSMRGRSDVLRFLEPYAPHYRIFNLCPLYEHQAQRRRMMVRPRVPLDGSSERLFLRLQFAVEVSG